jgi:uncharacterized repeat protein (TIGR01451 family)
MRFNRYLLLVCSVLISIILTAVLTGSRSSAAPEDATVPGQIRADATFEHIGVLWSIDGDADHDSSMTLDFREPGEAGWHPGAPAVRAYPTIVVNGSPLGLNYWAASAMFLKPGQTYDLRLTLTDPDGGSATQTTTAATRSGLGADLAGRQLYVVPGNGGGSGSATDPFLGLQSAANAAKAGDVFHIAPGAYAAFQLLASGVSGHPIVLRGPEVGVAIVDGSGTDRGIVTLGEYNQTIGYIIVEGLTIQNGAWGVDAQNTHDILLSRNIITDVDNGILNRRGNNQEYNQTISDNIIEGRTAWPGTGIPEEEGIDLRGTGNVVAYNRVSYFGDCISVNPQTGPSYGNDIFGNDVSYCVDDGIEIDDNQANARTWRNRVMNARMGVSVQPVRGGPAYIFRNEFFNLESDPIKMHNQTTGFWVAQNTGAMNGNGQSDDGAMWRNAVFRNNLFLGTRYAFEFVTVPDEGFRDFDYDAWGTTRVLSSPSDHYFKWNNVRYLRLPNLQAIGVEVHGVEAQYAHLVNAALPSTWDEAVEPGSRDLRLLTGSPEINAGVIITNINDAFVADGHPDVGAFEVGQPLPAYGPRPALPDLNPSTKQASQPVVYPGKPITFTITLNNAGKTASGIHMTDNLPSGLVFQGNLSASLGSAVYANGIVSWMGDVSAANPVTVTFDVALDPQITTAQVITNTATIENGMGGELQREATIIANGVAIFLPLTMR